VGSLFVVDEGRGIATKPIIGTRKLSHRAVLAIGGNRHLRKYSTGNGRLRSNVTHKIKLIVDAHDQLRACKQNPPWLMSMEWPTRPVDGTAGKINSFHHLFTFPVDTSPRIHVLDELR